MALPGRASVRLEFPRRQGLRVGVAFWCTIVFLGTHTQTSRAQAGARPEFVIGLSVGELSGGPLWNLPWQLAPVPPDSTDSLTLGRRLLRPSLVLGLDLTLFRSPLIGYTIEAQYLGFSTESSCAPLGPYVRDSVRLNEQACSDIQGRRMPSRAVAVLGGLTARSNAGGGSYFFLRALAGAAYLARSLTEMAGEARVLLQTDSGIVLVPTRVVFLEEKEPVSLTWIATVSGGARIAVSRDYNLAVQVSDVLVGLPVPTGPGSPASDPRYRRSLAPVARRAFHFPTISVAVDLVFGRARDRRY